MCDKPEREPRSDEAESFARQSKDRAPGVMRETFDFLADNKKWWLLPIIVALLLVGVLIIVGGSAAAPFIYPLF